MLGVFEGQGGGCRLFFLKSAVRLMDMLGPVGESASGTKRQEHQGKKNKQGLFTTICLSRTTQKVLSVT